MVLYRCDSLSEVISTVVRLIVAIYRGNNSMFQLEVAHGSADSLRFERVEWLERFG
jgi:hypothetical protein